MQQKLIRREQTHGGVVVASSGVVGFEFVIAGGNRVVTSSGGFGVGLPGGVGFSSFISTS